MIPCCERHGGHRQPDQKRRAQRGADGLREQAVLFVRDGRGGLLGEDDLQSGGGNAHQEKNTEQGKPDAVFLLGHPAVGHDLRRGHEHAAAHRGDDEPAALAEKGGFGFHGV